MQQSKIFAFTLLFLLAPGVAMGETATMVPDSFLVVSGESMPFRFSLSGSTGTPADYYIGFLTPTGRLLTVDPNLQLVEGIQPLATNIPTIDFSDIPVPLGPFSEGGTTTGAILVSRAGSDIFDPSNYLAVGVVSFNVLNLDPLLGSWSGRWNNTTFDSSGPIDMNVSYNQNTRTMSVTIDAGGNVFGGIDPEPIVISQSLNVPSPITDVQISGTSGVFGNYSVSIDVDGTISISVSSTNIPALGGGSITFSGTLDLEAQPPSIQMNYTISAAFTAEGTITITHD